MTNPDHLPAISDALLAAVCGGKAGEAPEAPLSDEDLANRSVICAHNAIYDYQHSSVTHPVRSFKDAFSNGPMRAQANHVGELADQLKACSSAR